VSAGAEEPRLLASVDGWNVERLHRQGRVLVVWGLLLVLIVIGSVMSGTFRSHAVVIETLRGATFLGMASAAQFFVVVSGGIDLSIAAVATLSGMSTASW
jgi:ribose/xylose/arabinose/galactoside ABC-type transport system permease subunit